MRSYSRRTEKHCKDHQNDSRERGRHDPDRSPRVHSNAIGTCRCVRIDDFAGYPRPNKESYAESNEADQSLSSSTNLRARLPTAVDLLRDEKEIVADAVKKNSEIQHPLHRADVAVREHQIAERPRSHAYEHYLLDSQPRQRQRKKQHEPELRHLPERLLRRSVRHA